MDISTAKEALSKLTSQYENDVGALKSLEKQKAEWQKEIESFAESLNKNELKIRLFKETSAKAREMACEMFCMISTQGLRMVLGDDISVKARVYESNEVPCLDFVILQKYVDEDGAEYPVEVDPVDEDGGGAADILALSAFVSLVNSAKNGNTAPLFLDEPMKFVSAGYAAECSKFLKAVSSEFKRQIIMVTHDTATRHVANKTFEVSLNEHGISQIKEIET